MKKTQIIGDGFVIIEGFWSHHIYQMDKNGNLKKIKTFKSKDLVLADEFTKVYMTRTDNGKILVYYRELFALKAKAFQRVISQTKYEIILATAEGEIWQVAIEDLEEGVRETTFRFRKK